MKRTQRLIGLLGLLVGVAMACNASGTEPGRRILTGQVPRMLSKLSPLGAVPATNELFLSIGLPLRNAPELSELLRQLQDPASSNYHRYLTPREFTARFGPTEAQYEQVKRFAATNGFRVAGTHPNRLVLDVTARADNIQRAFNTGLHTYQHPTEKRTFYAPDAAPSVPTNLPVSAVEGLSDYWKPHPLLRAASALKAQPLSGSGPSGLLAGKDFRNAYAPGSTLTGAGQSVGLLEFSAYYQADITNYENTIGATNYVPLVNVVVGHGSAPTTANNGEVALDIEVAIAMAPGLSQVIVYEEGSINPSTILSRMASDNLAKQLSSSWSWSGGPSSSVDSIFQQMAAQGQSFFQASGDNDAYTGTNLLDSTTATVAPMDSTNVTSVGGTTLTMSGSGTSRASETVWNYNSYGGQYTNEGSGGGISSYYTIPYWQTNVSMASNSGSTTWRNIPDVALTADQIYVAYNNGTSGGMAGTSAAAPLWAGFCALVNQAAVASGHSTVGFLNPALYSIARSTNYAACFHDITSGNNIGANTPGLYVATTSYDLCTGLGTPNGTGLITALVPYPQIQTQPTNQTVTNGNPASFSVTAGGQSPLGYQWRLNGTNLAGSSAVAGATSNILTLNPANPGSGGSYTVVITNSSGTITSSVATLTVLAAPSSLALAASRNPAGFRDSIFFTATMQSTNVTGTVVFYTNSTAYCTSVLASATGVSLTTSALPRGTNSITAIFAGNSGYLGATNSLLEVVTNHPPTAVAFQTNRWSGFAARIPITALSNSWSDVDGDTVSLSAIGLSTNGVTVTNSGGTLVYFNPNNVDDSFACTLSDGWGGSASQTVRLQVVALPTNAIPVIATITSGTNRTIALSLSGSPGLTYVLETSTNLALTNGWAAAATNLLGTNGVWTYRDSTTNAPQRFYRLQLTP